MFFTNPQSTNSDISPTLSSPHISSPFVSFWKEKNNKKPPQVGLEPTNLRLEDYRSNVTVKIIDVMA